MRGEEGEHLGVEPVGLGEPPERLGEGADVARIDDRDGEPGRGQRGGDWGFIATGRFEHDEGDGLGLTPGDEGAQVGGIRGELARQPRGLAGKLDRRFGDIQTEIAGRGHGTSVVAVTAAQPCRCGVDSGQLCGLGGPRPGGPTLACGLRPQGGTGSSQAQCTVRRRDKGGMT